MTSNRPDGASTAGALTAPLSQKLDAAGVELGETWRSRVFLTLRDVWKLRKPVRLGELDYTTLERRRLAAESEVRGNRWLAPDVYRGVVPVTRGADGCDRVGGSGPAVDWAVHMKRLPDRDRADARLRAGTLTADHTMALARRLAVFHETARSDAPLEGRGTPGALREQIGLVLADPSRPPRSELEPPVELSRAEQWQRSFLADNVERFEARVAQRRIRHGHGNLSLENVFLDDEGSIRIIGRLDFDESLRFGDVCADVAFLSNDLATSGRVDLAELLVAEYATSANDFDLYPLVDFYSSLGASFRGKLEWFQARYYEGDRRTPEQRLERARAWFVLATAAPRPPLLPPVVVVMGGQVASGKSTLAREIGRRISAPVVSSDGTRDFLLGARLDERHHEIHWERAYESGFGERVYAEVFRRAGAVLDAGRAVVIDGCFRSRAQRARARALADRSGHPFVFVEARVSEAVQRERLLERSSRDGVDAGVWLGIAADMSAEWEPIDEADPSHWAVDTGGSVEHAIEQVAARLPSWPVNPTRPRA